MVYIFFIIKRIHFNLFTLELLDFLGDFFEVAINMILYTREVYPESNDTVIIWILAIDTYNLLCLISYFH